LPKSIGQKPIKERCDIFFSIYDTKNAPEQLKKVPGHGGPGPVKTKKIKGGRRILF
jgi:hypothetical protein